MSACTLRFSSTIMCSHTFDVCAGTDTCLLCAADVFEVMLHFIYANQLPRLGARWQGAAAVEALFDAADAHLLIPMKVRWPCIVKTQRRSHRHTTAPTPSSDLAGWSKQLAPTVPHVAQGVGW